MTLQELIRKTHALIEAKKKYRISQHGMAQRIGVHHRTYVEYYRGTNAPLAMKAILNLLAMLEDKEIVDVIREWNKQAELTNDSNLHNPLN